MIPIRLNVTGYFTTDIDVHVVPLKDHRFEYHGCKPTGGIVHAIGRVDDVKYLAGHKNTVAAIVFMSAIRVDDE